MSELYQNFYIKAPKKMLLETKLNGNGSDEYDEKGDSAAYV